MADSLSADVLASFGLSPAPVTDAQLPGVILDALDVLLCVIDHAGDIRYVNAAWTQAALEGGGDPEGLGVGSNYLAACPLETLANVRAVLDSQVECYESEYECDTPVEERWYLMRVMPLTQYQPRWAVITHSNVTRNRRAVQALAEQEGAIQRAREQDSLVKMTDGAGTDVTASTFGLRLVRESLPATYRQLVTKYSEALEAAVERRTYKGEGAMPNDLRDMASQLAFLRAGPRDVIDIHIAALKERSLQAPPGRARAYAEESRLMILELMGHLAVTYRNEAFGIRRSSPEARST